MDILYLCNGRRPECAGKSGCMMINGSGICRHTTDKEYARSHIHMKALDSFMEDLRRKFPSIELDDIQHIIMDEDEENPNLLTFSVKLKNGRKIESLKEVKINEN